VSENHKRNADPVLIYGTYPTLEEAERIGGVLVDAGLVACVNIIPGMTSIYLWQGARHRDSECVMIAKTRADLANRVIGEVKSRHSYTNPALLVLPTSGGSAAFCTWIEEQTASPTTPAT